MAVRQAVPITKTSLAKTSGQVSVLTSSTVVAADNRARTEIIVTNDHASQVVYLAFATAEDINQVPTAPTATANNGVRLNAAGGSWSSTSYTGPVAGISVGGTSVVTVAEF